MRLSPAAAGPEYMGPAILIPTIARMTGSHEQLDVAEAAAQAILDAKSATYASNFVAWASLGLIAMLREDLTTVRQMYTNLEPRRGLLTGYLSDTILGLLAHTLDDLDQAAVHFEACGTWRGSR